MAVAVRLVFRLTSSFNYTSHDHICKGCLESVQASRAKLISAVAVQGGLGQGEENERFAGHGADVMM
jgi:hypothetical protein